jgi:hypothetical protein
MGVADRVPRRGDHRHSEDVVDRVPNHRGRNLDCGASAPPK